MSTKRLTPEELFPAIVVRYGVRFGRPFIRRRGISTSIIFQRCIEAGEVAADVAADYTLTLAEVHQAIGYECYLRRSGRRRPSTAERAVREQYRASGEAFRVRVQEIAATDGVPLQEAFERASAEKYPRATGALP